MILSGLKNEVINKLEEIYSPEEASSIFHILSLHYLKLSRIEVALQYDEVISSSQYTQFSVALSRLLKHEPVQYVIGEADFYGCRFKVNEFTLIPRSETEELVDWVIKDAEVNNLKNHKILDIGTGSGCIAVSLAKNLKNAKVTGIDVSIEALKIAKINSLDNDVKIDFINEDILKIEELGTTYDIIISNPPYVRELEKVYMSKNVLEFEPETALYVSNEDPLIFYRTIIKLASVGLNKGGLLYFEINEYLSNQLVTLLRVNGFKNTVIKKDVFGKDRMIKAKRK